MGWKQNLKSWRGRGGGGRVARKGDMERDREIADNISASYPCPLNKILPFFHFSILISPPSLYAKFFAFPKTYSLPLTAIQ